MCDQQYATREVALRQFNRDFDAATTNLIDQATAQATSEAAAAVSELISEAVADEDLASELTQAAQEELEDEYESAVQGAKDGLKGKSAVLYCSDNDENNIPDIWSITLNEVVVTASPILDLNNANLQDAVADAYAEAFSAAFQNALESLPPVEIALDSYWPEAAQDMMNLSNLSPEEQDQFSEKLLQLCQNCYYKSLLAKIDPNLSIAIIPDLGTEGGYSLNSNEIRFPTISGASGTTLAAELFHSYQAQCATAYIELANGPDRLGRSNIEFEEKINTMVAGLFDEGLTVTPDGPPAEIVERIEGLGGVPPGVPMDFYLWLMDLADNNDNVFPAQFTEEQRNFYTSAIEQFRAHHLADDPTDSSGYGAPINYDYLYPTCISEILAESDC